MNIQRFNIACSKIGKKDKEYIKVLDEVVTYEMTNGRMESQVIKYLDTEFETFVYIGSSFLLFVLAFGLAWVWELVDMINISLILALLPSILIVTGVFVIFSWRKYYIKSQTYLNVNEYVQSLDKSKLKEVFDNHMKNKKK